MSAERAPAYQIDSVDRALQVILAFQDVGELSINEVAAMVEVSRSTAFRLLTVLERRDFVHQDPKSKLFHSGSALLRTGLLAAHNSDVRITLRPLLEEVVGAVDETAHLVVLQRDEAFFIDCVEGKRTVRATSRVGTSLPAHVTASGLALLAHLPPAKLTKILSGPLPTLTSRSRTSARAIRAELQQVRARGWALNDGQSEVGLRAVAARIPYAPERVGIDVAITVAGPRERLDDDRVTEIAAILVARFAAHADDL